MKIVVFILLCVIWGTTWAAIKISLEGIPPFTGAAFRFCLAVGLLFIYAKVRNIPLTLGKEDFKNILSSALFLYLFQFGLIYWSEQYINAGVAAILYSTFPIFVGILSNFIFHQEEFRILKYAGLFLGFGGVVTIFYKQLLVTHFLPIVTLSALAMVIAAANGAISTVIVKKYLANVHPISITLHQMIWGIASLSLIGLLRGEFNKIHFNYRVLASILYLGVIGSAIVFVLYYWLLQKMSAISLSYYNYITPPIALLVDWIIFKEVPGLEIIVGMIIILIGIFLCQWQDYQSLLTNYHLSKIAKSKSKE